MARRDFTINAMARRSRPASSSTRSAASPTSRAASCGPSAPTSFARIRCASCAALRLVSQLGFDLAPETLAQMRRGGAGPRPRLGRADRRRYRGGRHGRALEAAARPRARRARSGSRATPACSTQVIPEFEPAIGYRLDSDRQPLPLDEHLFAVVQHAADAGASPRRPAGRAPARPRQARDRRRRRRPRRASAPRSPIAILERLRYPTRVRHHVVAIVAGHALPARRADRRPRSPAASWPTTATSSRSSWSTTSAPTSSPRASPAAELEALARLARAASTQERSQPHRLARPRGHRRRPERDRVRRRARARPRAARCCSTRSSTTRPATRATAARARARELAMNADAVRAAYAAVCAVAGPGVTVVAATKYVAARRDGGAGRGRGRGGGGEPRAGPAAQARAATATRSAGISSGTCSRTRRSVVNGLCELVHALDSDSAARRLTVPRCSR